MRPPSFSTFLSRSFSKLLSFVHHPELTGSEVGEDGAEGPERLGGGCCQQEKPV